jgi:hypothetical protein
MPSNFLELLKGRVNISNFFEKNTLNIVTCREVRVTKITGSRSDDYIYWLFGYNFFFSL